MQITDMLTQYNRNLANGTEIAGGTQGIKQVVSSLSDMAVGNVFEGSVNHLENGMVTLGLPDGKTIQARLDSGVAVKMGESMFFQVKANNGAQIAIRPFSGSFGSNPTLLNALEAANLPVNGKMITMVNTMMEQSMSIDKQSLMNMARLVTGNESFDVNTIVQMAKLGLPVTEEMAAQFENYQSDRYAILDQLESVMDLLEEEAAPTEERPPAGRAEAAVQNSLARPETITADQEKLLAFNKELMKVLFGGEGTEAEQEGRVLVNTKPETLAESVKETESILPGEDLKKAAGQEGKEPVRTENILTEEAAAGAEKAAKDQAPDVVKNFLAEHQLQHLAKQLADIPRFAENPVLFQDGSFRPEVTVKELMQFFAQAFASGDPLEKKALHSLVTSKEYRALIRNVMEQQWLMKPEELKSENKINELYERLDRQMNQMEKVFKAFGQNAAQFSDTVANVRSNIQFMNQINQIYSYVQIPLKLAGQNAHSDLFVYTDKRKKREQDGELTAFLHLDLDHLGSTDVSIKLHKKQVATNFYLSDDASYQLILENMDLLQKRLEKRGFFVTIQVTNQEKKADFVGNLLNQGTASMGGMVHRYSFDVRA